MSRTIILCVNYVTDSFGIGINIAQPDSLRRRFAPRNSQASSALGLKIKGGNVYVS